MTALALYRICCYMEYSITSSLKKARHFITHLPPLLLNAIRHRHIQKHTRHCAFFSTSDSSFLNPVRSRFDTDSFKIGIDTLCSVTMSPRKECFQDLKPVEGATVTGIAGGIVANARGTFCFNIEDDTGLIHTIKLPGSLYIPTLPQTLLCPQHWAQLDDDEGTYIKSTSTGCWLVWNKDRSRKFVPMDPKTNTPTFLTAPGTFNYRAFDATFMACDASAHSLQTHLTYDHVLKRGMQHHHPESFLADEDINLNNKHKPDQEDVNSDDETVQISNISHVDVAHDDKCPIHPSSNHKWGECTHNPANKPIQRGSLTFTPLSQQTDADKENEVLSASDDQAELLRWHHRLGHISFSMLKLLAKNGEIPRRLATVKEPKCAGCLFGKMTKVPWRTRSKANSKVHEATYPGECVSIDQMQSTQAGFYAQLKGKLTSKRYTVATIFVDHFSRLRYVHLMTSLSSQETIEAKKAFEQFAADHGVRIKQYHADNGRFADNSFKQHCSQQHQTISYCGVHAHFQHGIAERAIRDITDTARTILLHAKARWPSAVHLCLSPYAVRMAVYIY